MLWAHCLSDTGSLTPPPHADPTSTSTVYDILPSRAGKGAALSYLVEERLNKWQGSVFVAGDAFNDLTMLHAVLNRSCQISGRESQRWQGVLVGNAASEVRMALQFPLPAAHEGGGGGLVFAEQHGAWGIVEGLQKASLVRLL